METLFLTRGVRLSRKDNTISIYCPTQKIRRAVPVETLKQIVVAGATDLNSDLITFLGKAGVRVSFLDYYGYFSGSLEPANPHASGKVHLKQAEKILNLETRLSVARLLIMAGLKNCVNNLKYYQYRGNMQLSDWIQGMEHALTQIESAKTPEILMGYEGQARQYYYAAWGEIDPRLNITKRTRRPPGDAINALISFLNSLVYVTCRHELSKTHLDVTLSFVHSPQQVRASLALDLAEVFKPVLTDRLIFKLIRKRQITEADFEQHAGACLLTEKGRRLVLEAFSEQLDQQRLGDLVGYKQLILREAFKIEAHVLDMKPYEAYLQRN